MIIILIGLFQRKSKQVRFRIFFSEENPWNNICHFTLGNSRRKQAFTVHLPLVGNTKQGQKPRLMESQHEFFLSTTGNSISFLTEPWNFHMLFFQYSCLNFFWNRLASPPFPSISAQKLSAKVLKNTLINTSQIKSQKKLTKHCVQKLDFHLSDTYYQTGV